MKILLTGATGFVGAEVLEQLVANAAVTQITCITRREIKNKSPKVKTIIQSDFLHYDDNLLDELATNDSCIWALGGKASDLGTPEVFEQITYGFTLALAKGLAERAQHPFTFCYLSGMGADQSETAWLPWEKLTRHLKGRTEKNLNNLQDRYINFCVHSFRPAGILPDKTAKWWHSLLEFMIIRVNVLAKGMIAAATSQSLFRSQKLITNSEIKKLALRKSISEV